MVDTRNIQKCKIIDKKSKSLTADPSSGSLLPYASVNHQMSSKNAGRAFDNATSPLRCVVARKAEARGISA
jgi:hypothetical protein